MKLVIKALGIVGNYKHPEDYCHKCGGKNITWYVNNDLWNKVVEISIGILCPICFVEMAEKKGIRPTAWRLSREGDLPEIDELRLKNVELQEEIYQLIKQSQETKK